MNDETANAALEVVNNALRRRRENRDALSQELDAIDQEVIALARQLEAVMTTVNGLLPVNGPEDDTGVAALFEPLNAAIEAVEGSIDVALAAVAPCTSAIEQVADGCAVWQQEAELGFERVRRQWSDALQTIAQTSASIDQAFEGLEAQISGCAAARLEDLEAAVQKVGSVIDDSLVEIDAAADKATDAMANAYVQQVTERIDAAAGDIVQTVEHLLARAKVGVDDIVETLNGITETLGTVVEIVEPVLPVLDAAANLA